MPRPLLCSSRIATNPGSCSLYFSTIITLASSSLSLASLALSTNSVHLGRYLGFLCALADILSLSPAL